MNFSIQEINLGVTGLLVLVVIWQIIKIQQLDSVRKHFYSTGLRKNLETIVTEQDAGLSDLRAAVADLNNQTQELRTQNLGDFQKFGFVKFSQFGEAGNLSFALVLLNAHLDGVALSGLHGREGVRVYAKEIIKGKSKAKLTEEEQKALTDAINGQK